MSSLVIKGDFYDKFYRSFLLVRPFARRVTMTDLIMGKLENSNPNQGMLFTSSNDLTLLVDLSCKAGFYFNYVHIF
jgi:hypothetical protein